MEGTNWAGWIAVISFAVALGILAKNRLSPETEDRRTGLLTEAVTAIVAGVTIGSLPRLFSLDNEMLHWGATGVSAMFTILASVQLVRMVRTEPPVDASTGSEGDR